MRLTTWNCHHGHVRDRLARLEPLAPDLVTLQECRRPQQRSSHVIWSGAADSKGIAVATLTPSIRLERLPTKIAPTALTVLVHAPAPFRVVALWAVPPYEKFAVRALRACQRGAACDLPMVVMGDLNLTAKSEAVRIFYEELGLVSAYHAFHRVAPGEERDPTHFWRWQRTSPWHIDFCLVPKDWVAKIRDVKTGAFREWTDSDHRPVTITLDV